MKVILCTHCGNVIKRQFVNKCSECTQTDFAYYDLDSPKLEEHVRKIRGKTSYSSPFVSMLYLTLIISFILAMYYGRNVYMGRNIAHLDYSRPKSTAARPGSLVR